MTYDDIWWHFMTKHAVYHDKSWHVMTNHETTRPDSERCKWLCKHSKLPHIFLVMVQLLHKTAHHKMLLGCSNFHIHFTWNLRSDTHHFRRCCVEELNGSYGGSCPLGSGRRQHVFITSLIVIIRSPCCSYQINNNTCTQCELFNIICLYHSTVNLQKRECEWNIHVLCYQI